MRTALPAYLRRVVRRCLGRIAPGYASRVFARRYLITSESFLKDIGLEVRGITLVSLSEDHYLLRVPLPDGRQLARRVLIAPGHDGQFRQYVLMIQQLQARGIQADVLVYPGHRVARSAVCSIRHIVDSIQQAAAQHGPYDGLIGHCVGSNAALFCLRDGLSFPRLALVSTPIDFPKMVAVGGGQYGLTGAHLNTFVQEVSRKGLPYPIDLPWKPLVAQRQEPLLIVHAQNDWVAPVSDTEELAAAWPGARRLVIPGSGHNEVLFSRSAAKALAAFFAEEAGAAVTSTI